MRISDWSSDVCSSDLPKTAKIPAQQAPGGDDLLILIISERGGPDRARRRGPARVGIVYVQRLFGTHRFAHRREQGRVRFAPLTVHRPQPRLVDPLLEPIGARRRDLRQRHSGGKRQRAVRSEEHTSELQALMSISYAVLCWKK